MIYEDIYAYLKDELNVMEIDPVILGHQEIGYILFVLANMQGIKSYDDVGIFTNVEYKGAPENSIIFMPAWCDINDEAFEKNIAVSKYINADVFVNTERRTAILLGCDSTRIIRKLITIFPLVAPWLFKSIGNKEKAFLKNLKFGYGETNPDVVCWHEKLELADANMMRMLKSLSENIFGDEIKIVNQKIESINNVIEDYRKAIEDSLSQLENLRIRKLGLLAGGTGQSSAIEEIKTFLKYCKDVKLIAVNNSVLRFEIFTDCEIWDDTEAEYVCSNQRSTLFSAIAHRTGYENAIIKRALEKLFIERTHKIKFYGKMSIDLLKKNVNNDARTMSAAVPNNRIFNPHISPSMNCMTQYASVITQAMEDMRLDEALNYILMAIKSISLFDGFIMERLIVELERNKCIEAPDGTMMNLKDLLWEAEKELNNENNNV